MTEFQFRPAASAKAKVRIAIEGPAGSGKTLGALLVAHGLGEKIAVIDTETRVEVDQKTNEVVGVFGRSEQYAGWEGQPLRFDACPLLPPHSPERYMEALDSAYRAGYEVVIVDSLSHEWAGQGGVLELVDEYPSKNKFEAWKVCTPVHRAVLEKILRAPCHVICTLRTKTSYELIEENGRKVARKFGLAPVAREGTDYEFDLVFGIDLEEHRASLLKANAFYSRRLREEVVSERRLTQRVGCLIRKWADAGCFEKGAGPTATPIAASEVSHAERSAAPSTAPATATPSAPAAAPATPELTADDVLDRIGRTHTRYAQEALAAKPDQPATITSSILKRASRVHGKDLVGRLWEEVGGQFFGHGRSKKRRSLTGTQLRALIQRLPVKFGRPSPLAEAIGTLGGSAVSW